eukprot:scaffold602_cov179-Ochromonas_danica.AAC.17
MTWRHEIPHRDICAVQQISAIMHHYISTKADTITTDCDGDKWMITTGGNTLHPITGLAD